MGLMQPCSDLPFKVCGFERWVLLQGRLKAAESKSDSALHGSRSANRKNENKIPLSLGITVNSPPENLFALHHQQVLASHDCLLVLIKHLTELRDDSMIGEFRRVALLLDGDSDSQRIANEYRLDKTKAIVAVGERFRIDLTGREADGNAEHQSSMGHALLERLQLAPLRIHMVGVKVTRLSGMKHNVGFGDSATRRVPG